MTVTNSTINVNGAILNYVATGGTFADGVFVLTGPAADNITVVSKRPDSPLGIDAGGGGDTVTVQVANNSLYNGFFADGGESNTAGDAINFTDVSGGAAFQTLPLGGGVNLEQVSYSGTDVSDIVFTNFGSHNP